MHQREEHNLTVKVTVEVFRGSTSDPLLVSGHKIVAVPGYTEGNGWGYNVPPEDQESGQPFQGAREFIRDTTMTYLEGLHRRRREQSPDVLLSADACVGVYTSDDGEVSVMTRKTPHDLWGPPVKVERR